MVFLSDERDDFLNKSFIVLILSRFIFLLLQSIRPNTHPLLHAKTYQEVGHFAVLGLVKQHRAQFLSSMSHLLERQPTTKLN